MVIKRVGPLSVAKISGSLYAVIGLCVGGLFSLVALAGAAFGGGDGQRFGTLLGVGAIVAFPIFYGVLGFVFSLVAAAIYNVLAGVVGGIEIDTE